MTTGTPRIAWGIVLIAALVLFALRGVLVLVLGVLTGRDASSLLGTVIGIVIVSVLIVLVILGVLAKGLAQRRASLATRPSADPLALLKDR